VGLFDAEEVAPEAFAVVLGAGAPVGERVEDAPEDTAEPAGGRVRVGVQVEGKPAADDAEAGAMVVMEEEPVGRVRVEVGEGIEEEGSPVGGIFPGDVARGAVGKAEVHEGVGLTDAVHLVEEADEVLEVFEEMGRVDFVDRSVPERERTGDIGTDIDAGERREVDAERSRVLTESAPEVHDDPFSRLRHAHVPRRVMTAPGWSKYGPRAATGKQAP
jgi:hypothetical protein